jgi:hypothetical protein
VVEHVAQPQEAVGLELQASVHGPVKRPEEVLLPEVAPLIVPEMGQVGPAKMRVAQRHQPGHYSANPFDASSGRWGRGAGPFTALRYSSYR